MTMRHRTLTAAFAATAAAALAGCASTPLDGATTGTPGSSAPTTAAAAPAPSGGRDWSQIDTDRDHLVSPAEMERWLAANPGPQR